MTAAPSDPPVVPEASARALWWPPLLVFVLALLVSGALLAWTTRSIQAKDRASFENEVTRTTDAVRERIDTTVTLLRATAGLLAAAPEVDRQRFAAYMQQVRLRERYPGILGIGYSERVAAADVPALEHEMQRQGLPQFHVWPAQARSEYHVIVFLEPMDARNSAAMGYDMFTDATRREAMARARDTGVPAASGRVQLVQEIDASKQSGLLIYLPTYAGSTTPASLAGRRENLRGFVYAPLRVGDLLQGVRGSGLRQVDYALYDGAEAGGTLMLSTREAAAKPALFHTTRVLDVAGRTWVLRFDSTPAFETLSQRRLVPWLGAASLAVAALLGWITFVQARARRDAEAAAAQRRRNEQALQASEERERERAQRLQQLYGELRDADRRKDEFLAVLAHELRNPLAPIRNALEILRRAPDGPAARGAREIAERQVRHMVRLIDDLLDVSRISRGKIVLQPEPLALADVVAAAVETSRPLIEQRKHHLEVQPVDPALVLRIDGARVAQILTNLLNNAAHYTPPGGRIAVSVHADPQEVRVSVRDNGIGIAPEQLQHVFELFAQVQPASSGGLGIGLSLAARLAQLHGGRIEAHSGGTGQGSEFVLVLPRDGIARAAAAEEQPEAAGSA